MTEIHCDRIECENCGPGMKCHANRIKLCIDDEECNQYAKYTESEEYQQPYFKRVQNHKITEQIGREGPFKMAAKGKRIEMGGFVVFTNQDDRNPPFPVTEERTGMLAVSCRFYDEHSLAHIKICTADVGNVTELPEVIEYEYRKFKLKEEKADE